MSSGTGTTCLLAIISLICFPSIFRELKGENLHDFFSFSGRGCVVKDHNEIYSLDDQKEIASDIYY